MQSYYTYKYLSVTYKENILSKAKTVINGPSYPLYYTVILSFYPQGGVLGQCQ